VGNGNEVASFHDRAAAYFSGSNTAACESSCNVAHAKWHVWQHKKPWPWAKIFLHAHTVQPVRDLKDKKKSDHSECQTGYCW